MRKLIFIILLVGFSAIYYYSTLQDESSIVQKTIADVKNMVKNSTVFKKDTDSKKHDSVDRTSDKGLDDSSAVSLQSMDTEELKKWISSESNSMNSVYNKTEEIQIKLKAQAQTLSPEQFETLKSLALYSGLPINERILSAYLITLSSAAPSLNSLYDIAKSEVPDVGPIVPHSEAELRHTQELAIRYMLIDELFERAKTDANAQDKLKLLVQTASSEQVRNYAQKKLQELK
ncbi:MAG: hypothetical protein AABY53_07720 [Bdellovibrionota bacterium]